MERIKLVDVHTHSYPPEIGADRARLLAAEPDFTLLYSSEKACLIQIPELLAMMDMEGVETAWVVGFPWRDIGLARMHNDYLACQVKDSRGRLRGLACVYPDSPGALAEAERALGLGLSGLGELALYQQDLDSPNLHKLCALAAEANKPLMLHTDCPWSHNYPGKSPMTLAALYNLLKQNPRTRIILAHLGGGIFFLPVLRKHDKDLLANVWLDTAAGPYLYQPAAYRWAIEAMGIHKLLLGSDYPLLTPSRHYAELLKAGLNQEELAMVARYNSKALIP